MTGDWITVTLWGGPFDGLQVDIMRSRRHLRVPYTENELLCPASMPPPAIAACLHCEEYAATPEGRYEWHNPLKKDQP